MKLVADRVDSAAVISLMDLSVEAECFGSQIVFSESEVPTVKGSIITEMEEVEELEELEELRSFHCAVACTVLPPEVL